jgi:hypothetical protein
LVYIAKKRIDGCRGFAVHTEPAKAMAKTAPRWQLSAGGSKSKKAWQSTGGNLNCLKVFAALIRGKVQDENVGY